MAAARGCIQYISDTNLPHDAVCPLARGKQPVLGASSEALLNEARSVIFPLVARHYPGRVTQPGSREIEDGGGILYTYA